MAIISKNNENKSIQFKSAQFRYSVVYVVITFAVLLILNIYCAKGCQTLFYNNKKSAMIDICDIASSNISALEVMNKDTISPAIVNLVDTQKARMVVTDTTGKVLFDTAKSGSYVDKYLLFPEIVQALDFNDVFRWMLNKGEMRSYAAVPIISYGTLTGCVYMTESDPVQGKLISTLQNSIFIITVILELAIILFSLVFSNAHTYRIKKIMSSIRNVRDGDYANKLHLSGNDELNVLSDEFNDLIDRLQISENKRNQFVSDASHELKTPLASIKLLSDSILQNQMDMDTINEFVSDIGHEADRLNRMSHKLLSLSRIDTQEATDSVPIQIAPTVARVIRMLSPTAESNEVKIQTDLSCQNPVAIPEDDLYQVLFNLVENGIKYNRRGGILTIAAEKKEQNAIITVSDTGLGIPPESLEHIYDRFYRVDKARSRSTGGSGLGLSIVRHILRRYNGEIHVESKIGTGTTFELSLPVYRETEVAE